jgi:hypothetical protein
MCVCVRVCLYVRAFVLREWVCVCIPAAAVDAVGGLLFKCGAVTCICMCTCTCTCKYARRHICVCVQTYVSECVVRVYAYGCVLVCACMNDVVFARCVCMCMCYCVNVCGCISMCERTTC